ncbi:MULTISPECIES: cytochrome P450 [unclassified Streptomyces]|uniref:cytochrome P450 n=1 Tax=unclassified Streptomyces TaxID=2593676 RepID=UPI001BE585CB|nr:MULTISPECIES: cytochrome P450 [unclassified Streptomyces]MBT2405890.1 cytochrome P450 [Streptomyces sp. ISL-21]MBT2612292.1 cytochrome P450 [Streptomyces sp. ISL-87]
MSTVADTRATREWRVAQAPGALPLLGHALNMGRNPLRFLSSLSRHADLVELRIGRNRAFLPCHPELVQQVLVNARVFDTGGPVKEKARPILGNGLITSDWADHRRQRRLVQPAFHPARIATYAQVMHEEVEAQAARWSAGQVVDVSEVTQALTARITARALFSLDIAPHAVAVIQHSLPVIVRGAYRNAVDPTGLLAKLPTAANREFTQALARLHEVIDGIVEDYRVSEGDRGDLLSALLAAEDPESGERLSDQEIHDQVMTLLLAGIETTASALTWAFHLLARNPEAESRLHEEVDRVLGSRSPVYADLPELAYTQRVFTETLRLFPPAWLYTRTTTAATELGGRRLQPGDDILISPYVIHRIPELFARPEHFDPDRWLPARAKEVTRGSYLPFGGGSRKCIGDVFGMTEATLALAAIASRWRLRPVPGTRITPRPQMSLTAGPLPMTVQPR